MVIELTGTTFDEEVFKSDLPVLIDFWAPWCAPCNAMAVFIEEAAQKLNGKAKICKVNAESQPDLTERFRVLSVPTLMLVKNGKIITRFTGAKDTEELIEFLDL